ncbi:MAG: hypothetical protein H6867_04090 [Rhodospirillales bacterium]|nr:hypothetical protein [Rhodospirillales bacterium]MCB9996331.1 hypothetical protein [Rhodospirillales bacterium]
MKQSLLVIIALSTLVLTGCVNREQADAKLTKACQAAVNVFLPEGQHVEKVSSTDFTASPEGPDFRHVTIHSIVMDGWLETQYDYECVFQEGFGFMNSNFTASIHQVIVDGQVYGKAGNEILGDAQDHIKLNEAVRKALYEN